MNKWIKKLTTALVAGFVGLQVVAAPLAQAQAPEKVDFILDWVPNTNHTGLYVALEKGYFKEAGVEVDVKRPPEGSTTELIALGKAQFGIGFQDFLAKRFEGGAPITAVAAIIEHNTSGIISNKAANITKPAEMIGHSYGTWDDPIELAMLKLISDNEEADFSQVKLVPNQADNSIIGLANNMFESAWVYYAWDGVMAKHQNVDTNFFFLKDYAEELDYYSPVIIANNDYLAANPDQAKAVLSAIKKGYQYAIANPEESAEILIKHAPELEETKEFVLDSQKWLSAQYAENADKWGHFDEMRWNKFYQWLFENKLTTKDLSQEKTFTNEFLGE